MTILHQPKASQQGDSDEPPPKKKLKKNKSLRGSVASHNVSVAGTSSAPGPSQRRQEPAREHYHFLADFDTDHSIQQLTLDKFDVGFTPRSSAPPAPHYPEYAAPGPSHVVKAQINNPDYLEYYIYGPGSRSPNSKSRALKRPSPDVDAIEVISSEDIAQDCDVSPDPPPASDGISLLDDIHNFDVDDKFGELEKCQQEALWEDSKMHHQVSQVVSLMPPPMNGYEKVSPQVVPRAVAALSNLGNTCFLNCVLYTLRYAPNFLHNLHHLVSDINLSSSDIIQKKTASLGRSASLISKFKNTGYSGGAGDLADSRNNYPKTSKQRVAERLHEVYEAMRQAEVKGQADPYLPEKFLTALRDVNPIFEGNQQQDAHELLVCLLDIFRETSQMVRQPSDPTPLLDANSQSSRNSSFGKAGKPWTFKNMLKFKNRKNAALKDSTEDVMAGGDNSQHDSASMLAENNRMRCDTSEAVLTPPATNNFVAHDFEGVMVLRTTCLECENTTEKNEPFADICIPIKTEPSDDPDEDSHNPGLMDPSDVYKKAVVTDEFLRDRNKYYCEGCQRYNEARRSVRYRRLPRLLTLQLKRFSSTYGAMSKVTAYMPTPMTLACFCEDCIGPNKSVKHGYELYGVIMHLGPNMAGGHYIAYVKTSDVAQTYIECSRECFKPSAASSVKPGFNIFSKTSSGQEPPNGLTTHRTCRALDCCAVRTGSGEAHCGDRYEDNPWMACDDEIVKVLSAGEVETLLSQNSTSNATPYLLFYVRRTIAP